MASHLFYPPASPPCRGALGRLSPPLQPLPPHAGLNSHIRLHLLDFNGSACKMKLGRAVNHELSVCLSSISREKCKALRAVGGSSSAGEEEARNEDDLDVASDALRATIKKSKKVLAMQRNLLQQIVERRKLVSSIKDTAINTEDESVSYSETDSSFSNLDIGSISGNLDRTYNTGASESYAQSIDVSIHANPEIRVSGEFPSDEEYTKTSTEVEHSVAEALGLSREVDLVPVQSEVMQPVVPEASESCGAKYEKVDGITEKSAVVENTNEEVAHEEQNAGSPPLAGANVMNVIVVAAECAPWSKTGGLGDVAGALPKALARRGHRVMVVAPRYGNYVEPQHTGVCKRYKVDGQDMEVTYLHAYIEGVDFVFIDSPLFCHIENDIYGGNRLVCWHVPCGGVCYGDGNLVFIANDWHTALLPVYLKAYYRDHGSMIYARCVLVIHNIAHQGRGPVDDFFYVDLPSQYMDLFKLYDPVGGEHFNIFAAGLKTADRVVTVSHGYAWELKTPEGGWGLQGIINENDWKFQGIVNGIDTKEWNPRFDVHLKSDGYTNYSLETLQEGKAQCKAALQRELGLPVRNNVPVLAFIGRLDHQKGVDLIAEAMPWIVGQDVQLIMLGTGRQDLEDMLRRFESQHHDNVRGWVGFSVKMAHRITAGADILLMPSRFEPCGLNQLYAMMYGTVPVVHAVGGLRDTVHQFDPYREAGFGWTFERAEANRLIDALGNCLNTYRNFKSSWEGLQKRGMMQELSWDNAAQRYEEVLVTAKFQW